MNNNVLFVDDEIHIIKAIKRGLYKENYNMFFASSGEEALKILENEDIHVIVSDMKMPKMTGLELLTIVKEKYPKVIKIILSGYTQLQQIIVTINKIDIYKFITKPWDIEVEFKAVIRSAIDLYNTREENENLKKSIELKNNLYQKMLQSNNEKFALMKKNLHFISSINEILVKYYFLLGLKLDTGSITRDRYFEEIEFISKSMELIIKKMPSELKEFNVQMLEGKMKSIFRCLPNFDDQIAEVKDLTENQMFLGEYNFVYEVIESVLKNYFEGDTIESIDLIVSKKSENEESNQLVFLFRINGGEIIDDLIRKKSIEMIYECLLKTMDGAFSVEDESDEKLLIIKIPIYEKVEDNV